MPRQLKRSWIEEYLGAITTTSEAPEQYNFWCAATAVAATLKRHCYYTHGSFKLYPNLYTILVGTPGAGKGSAINPVLNLLKEANVANILSDRLTIEFILEKLAKGFSGPQHTATGITIGTDSSAIIFAPELSVLIRANSESLGDLSDLWDSREHPFSYGTRGKGHFTITKPCVSFLGGSAPQWLIKSIPKDAVGGGFTRRVNFVYAKALPKSEPEPKAPKLGNIMADELRYIAGNVKGEFKFDVVAKPIFKNYYLSSNADDFDDEAIASFKTSKWAHAVKLAMVLAAAESDALFIRKHHIEEAIKRVDKSLAELPMVFRAVGESDLVVATDKVLRYLENIQGYASFQKILHDNWRDVSMEDLVKILTMLETGGLVGRKNSGNKEVYYAVPVGKPASAANSSGGQTP